MRVAALYDIHGNLPALEAVLAEVDDVGADVIVAGGDIASGPMPRETLAFLTARRERIEYVRGNADRALIEVPPESNDDDIWVARDRWAAAQLTEPQRAFLSRLPQTLVLDLDGLGRTLFCHGSPRSDEEIITRATPETRLREMLAGVGERTVVCGHTHVQFDRVVDDTRVVNAGSVGMPYEDTQGAYWALLGRDVELRRTGYDHNQAAERIRATGFPGAAEFAVEHIVNSTSASEATEFFERMSEERLRAE